MQALITVLVALATLAILAGRYGVDSREGFEWSARRRPHRRAAVSSAGDAEPPSQRSA
jgi:hypothetical protein